MDALLAALMAIGTLVAVGAVLLMRRLPRDLRPLAIVPLAVVLVGFGMGWLVLFLVP